MITIAHAPLLGMWLRHLYFLISIVTCIIGCALEVYNGRPLGEIIFVIGVRDGSLVSQIIEYAVNLDDQVSLCHRERQTQEYKDAKWVKSMKIVRKGS